LSVSSAGWKRQQYKSKQNEYQVQYICLQNQGMTPPLPEAESVGGWVNAD
jgi:hypothetical protein